MALSPEQAAQRIKAAREAAGLKQAELAGLVHIDGFGKTDVGRLERPLGKKKPPPLSPARIDSLARHTRFPKAWFTEPDTAEVFRTSEPESGEADRLRAEFQTALRAMKLELLKEIEQVRQAQASPPSSEEPGAEG